MLNYGESLCRPASSASNSSSSGSSCEQHRGVRNGGGRSPSSSATRSSSDRKCSQQSVLTAIERFVRAVNNMDATVLVPSRLHDMEIQNRRFKTSLPPAGMQQQQHQDLYGFYVMLREVKTELLWGPSIVSPPSSLFHNGGSSTPLTSGMSSPRRMVMPTAPSPNVMMMTMSSPGCHQHLRQLSSPSYRQPSDDGLGSSSTGCSSDQDTDSDFESIVTDRDSMIMEQTSHLANAFRHHLHGLHAILHQLADTADFVSARYQEEVETIMI